jgi:hypothetical protein
MKGAKKRRSPHRTQWASQFAVASELCKRGYEVAFTMGNHPLQDLMVISPSRVPFVVDVMGLYQKNVWPVRRRPRHKSLFYVFAFVPDSSPNQFFILTQSQVDSGIRTEFEHTAERKRDKGKTVDPTKYFYGIEWGFISPY